MRIEEDLIGKLEIPEDALYGINTVRTYDNLTFSEKKLSHYFAYISALAMVKKAAAKANMNAGILSMSMCDAICSACDDLIEGRYHEQMIVDVLHGGGGIGINMNCNEVICNLANEIVGGVRGIYDPIHPVNHVNASQSTNDVCHTAIRLAIIMSYQSLKASIEKSIETLKEKELEFENVPTISRTCLQDGMRKQLGETFGGYASVIRRRLIFLDEAVKTLHNINFGGTVIGSGVGATKEYREQILSILCEAANLNLSHRENLFDAAQNIDDLASFSSELCLLSTCLIKIAKDLRLLSSGPEAGFGEINLPSLQAGSSFFPGKINPVVPETLIQCCFQVIGCDRVVQAALEHGELDLNVFEGIAGINIMDAVKMLENALSKFTEYCVKGIEANGSRCESLSNSFIPIVVELKERHGYSTVSQLIKEKGKEGVKKFYLNGGDEIGRNESNSSI